MLVEMLMEVMKVEVVVSVSVLVEMVGVLEVKVDMVVLVSVLMEVVVEMVVSVEVGGVGEGGGAKGVV